VIVLEALSQYEMDLLPEEKLASFVDEERLLVEGSD